MKGYILRIFSQHFATKLWNIANFETPFLTVQDGGQYN
jgi:hypothetical protein